MASLRQSVLSPDRGDVLLSWLTKLLLTFAVIGVIGFDGVSVITARLSVQDEASLAARTASSTWAASHDVMAAYATAVDSARSADPVNEIDERSFSIAADNTVTLTVRREAPTFVVRLVPPLRRLADVRATESGRSTT